MDHSLPDSQNPYASPAILAEAVQAASSLNKPNEPLVQPIRISGSLSLQDYFRGVRLGRRRVHRFLLLLCLAVLILLWVTAYRDKSIERDIAPIIVLTIVIPLVWLGVFVGVRWFTNLRVRKSHALGKGPFAPTEAFITEDGYEVHRETVNANTLWSAYCKYRHSDEVAVLFLDGNPNMFVLVPRNHFQTQHDWDCFLGLLERKLPRC
jgi:hypothetical protein